MKSPGAPGASEPVGDVSRREPSGGRTPRLRRPGTRLEQAFRRLRGAWRGARPFDLRWSDYAPGAHDLLLQLDSEGRILAASASAARVLGRAPAPREALIDWAHPEDRERVASWIARATAGKGAGAFEWRARHANGGWVWMDTTASPVDRVSRAVVVARDATPRRLAEEERRREDGERVRAQKLESLGLLAGGIAHDFNNLLYAIDGFVTLASHDLPKDAPAQEHLAQVRIATDRALALTRQILTYSRRGGRRDEAVDLRDLFAEVLALLRPSLEPGIEIRESIRAQRTRVRGDPGQLHQVLSNLCQNAVQAMDTRGTLTLSLDEVPAPGGDPDAPAFLCIRVEDTGVGMEPDTLQRAFDPFFTTRGAGSGTGMGLALVQGIVQNHGGQVEVESEPGRGSTFRVSLPALPTGPKGS